MIAPENVSNLRLRVRIDDGPFGFSARPPPVEARSAHLQGVADWPRAEAVRDHQLVHCRIDVTHSLVAAENDERFF